MVENLPSKFNFRDTTATKKIFGLKKRIRAVCGGTSASKTISILIWLIDYAQSTKNKKIDIMSESYPHLEDGAIKDFKAIMMDRGYWDDSSWNETKHIYTFRRNSIIKFISIDKLGKAHGPRRDVLFINEANNIDYNIYDQLEVRTKEVVWLDWNPSTEFWYYDKIKGKVDHDFITLTYLDCLEVLDQRIIDSIESHKDNKNWWAVYGLGQLGEVEGKIYKDWAIIDEVPHEARLERYGLDFGFSGDPAAIVAIYRYNGGFIFDQIAYKRGLFNDQLAAILSNQPTALVMADSSEPKSIAEIAQHGITILPCVKGADSIRFGIEYVQSQRVSVTQRSVDIIKEYRNYMWKTDSSGNIVAGVPEGGLDHSMDAIRYGMETLVRQTEEYYNIIDSTPYRLDG